MKKLNTIFTLMALLCSSITFAKVDPHNTYQWDRKNVLRGNAGKSEKPWFEWWYYKVIVPETNESFYFVYGVVNPWDKNKKLKASRSYVGIGDFTARSTSEETFAVDEFEASYKKTDIKIGKNLATDKHFSGDIIDEHAQRSQWDISINKKWGINRYRVGNRKEYHEYRMVPSTSRCHMHRYN